MRIPTLSIIFGITNLGDLVGETNFGGRSHGFYAVKQEIGWFV